MGVTPNDRARWINDLMLSFDFSPSVDPETFSIGLTLNLSEEVPEYVFQNLRFEMLIPIVNLEEIKDLSARLELIRRDAQYSKIAFAVDDVLGQPGSNVSSYALRLLPVGRGGIPDDKAVSEENQDHRRAFESLIHQMSLTGNPISGGKLEWRNGFNVLRFYHMKHQDKRNRVQIPNPLYVPVTAIRSCGLINRLPTNRGMAVDPENDARELDALLAAADDAFSDPSPPKPPQPARARHESFGYDTYLVHGQEFDEFDLDEALKRSAS